MAVVGPQFDLLRKNDMTTEDHSQMITDCENRESKLSDWERSFIDSISMQMSSGGWLTEKQSETLDKIWERVT